MHTGWCWGTETTDTLRWKSSLHSVILTLLYPHWNQGDHLKNNLLHRVVRKLMWINLIGWLCSTIPWYYGRTSDSSQPCCSSAELLPTSRPAGGGRKTLWGQHCPALLSLLLIHATYCNTFVNLWSTWTHTQYIIENYNILLWYGAWNETTTATKNCTLNKLSVHNYIL